MSSTPTETSPEDGRPTQGGKDPIRSTYHRLLRDLRLHPEDATRHLAIARFLLQIRQAKRAFSHLRVAKALQPRRSETYYLLGWLYQQEKNHPQALVAYRQLLKLKPGDAKAYWHLGSTHLALGNRRGAIKAFQRLTQLDPSFADAYWHLADLALEDGDAARALSYLKYLRTLKPDDPRVHRRLGDANVALGVEDEAVLCFRKALDLAPQDGDTLLALARLYVNGDLPGKALEILEELRTRDKRPELFLLLSRAHRNKGDMDRALASLIHLTKIAEEDGRAPLEMGRIYTATKEFDLAEEAFLRAVRLLENPREAWFDLGNLYVTWNKPNKAIKTYKDLTRTYGDRSDVFERLGEVYERFGKLDEAIESFGRAVELSPEDEGIYCKRGKVQVKAGRYDEAVRDFARAKELNPRCEEAHLDTELIRGHKKFRQGFEYYSKAQEAFFAGNYEGARASYEKALERVPNNPRWMVDYARLAVFVGDFETARGLYEKLTHLQPDDAPLLFAYGELEYRLHRFDLAHRLFERCASADPGHVEARVRLIQTLRHRLIAHDLAPDRFDVLKAAYSDGLKDRNGRDLAHLELGYLDLCLGSHIFPAETWVSSALEHFESVSDRASDAIVRLARLGVYEAHRVLGNDTAALGAIEGLTQRFPHNADYAVALLEQLELANEHTRGLRLAEDLVERFPEHGYLRALSLRFFRLVHGDREQGSGLLRKRIARLQTRIGENPRSPWLFYDLGLALLYFSKGNDWFEAHRKMTIALNKAKELAPRSPWPWWALVQANLAREGQTSTSVSTPAKLRSILQAALRSFPRFPFFHHQLGREGLEAADPVDRDMAVRQLIKATVVGEEFAPAAFALGCHYHELQDLDVAYHYFIQTLESPSGVPYTRRSLKKIQSIL